MQYRQTNKKAMAERAAHPQSGVQKVAPRYDSAAEARRLALGQAEQSLQDARQAIDQALAMVRAARG